MLKISPGKSRFHHDGAPFEAVHRFGRDRRFTGVESWTSSRSVSTDGIQVAEESFSYAFAQQDVAVRAGTVQVDGEMLRED
jgi:hypothetical protein